MSEIGEQSTPQLLARLKELEWAFHHTQIGPMKREAQAQGEIIAKELQRRGVMEK